MKRQNDIDILRAYGIIFMVMGHIFTFYGKFDRYIHTFHMPLFFAISGYLYRTKDEIPLYRLIFQKAKRLLVPYLTFAAINYIAWLFLEYDGQAWYEPLRRLFTYNTSGLPICGALWFLTALFWTEVFYMSIDRLIRIPWLRSIIVFVIAVTSCAIQNYTEFRLPLTIDIGLACMGFYEIGRLFRAYGEKIVEFLQRKTLLIRFFIGLILFLVNGILAFVNDYVNIKSGWYGMIPLFWVNAVLGIAAFSIFASLAEIVLRDKNVLKHFLVFIGRGSIVFLGLNQLMIMIGNNMFYIVKNQWILGVVVFIMVMGALSLIYLVLDQIKLKVVRTFFGI